MKSVLIRYIDGTYADSYLNGELYMSSLSKFWNMQTGRIQYEDILNGKVSVDDWKRAARYQSMRQQDFSEGVVAQIPNDRFLIEGIPDEYLTYDIRFRIEAYQYCNLLCFFRVDIGTSKRILLDEDNLSYLLAEKNIKISGDEIRRMDLKGAYNLLGNIINLDRNAIGFKSKVIQLPNAQMDQYGDTVILIKNTEEFVNRVIMAIKQQGGDCIIGDVRYHEIKNRAADSNDDKQHVSLVQNGDQGLFFDLDSILTDENQVIRYGSLDKYDVFKGQKEWRVCWLPEYKNNQDKILHVGDLRDIIEVISRESIRDRLMKIYPDSIPGFINKSSQKTYGTVTYDEFKELVENIDGKCRIIVDMG